MAFNGFAVSEFFHSAKRLPLAVRIMLTGSMMLGLGYSLMWRTEKMMGGDMPLSITRAFFSTFCLNLMRLSKGSYNIVVFLTAHIILLCF